jgi:transketolase
VSELKINESTAKTWSKLGPRATYGIALLDLVAENSNMIAASADLGNSSGLERLKKSYPDRYIDVGIAEQNLIGVSSGIAKEGFTVFASSFAPFITMRACEQVRMNLGYMQHDVKIVGIGSGLAMNFLGNSHFGLEDVSIIRSIPNIDIVSPSDCTEVVKAVKAISASGRPTYLRLTGSTNMPIVNERDYNFELGKFIQLKSGGDLTIIATGSMVHVALEVSVVAKAYGLDCGVVNCHTIRPLDMVQLQAISQKTSKILVLEEHFVSGGLGTAILEALNEIGASTRIKRIGIENQFKFSGGSYYYLLKQYKLDCESILSKVTSEFK